MADCGWNFQWVDDLRDFVTLQIEWHDPHNVRETKGQPSGSGLSLLQAKAEKYLISKQTACADGGICAVTSVDLSPPEDITLTANETQGNYTLVYQCKATLHKCKVIGICISLATSDPGGSKS
jgi:hypothetical protein